MAVVAALFVSFTYVAGQMRGVGVVFGRYLEPLLSSIEIFGLDNTGKGVVIGMVVVFFYAVIGGMKGITYTQVAQFCVLIFAFMVPAIFLSMLLVDSPIPQIGFGGKVADGSYLLDKLDGVLIELGFSAYTEGSRSIIDIFCITAALMLGTAGLPHVIVRFFTVPKVRDARKSAGYALAFIAILYTTAPAVAAFGMYNMLESIQNKEVSELPQWVSNWQETGLIAIEDKNADRKVQYALDAAQNELTIDKDIMVLANPEIAQLPNWVIGLVAAGGLAAALSTAAGLLW